MTEKILTATKQGAESLELVPSDGGKFEIFVDGKQIYSKLETGEFPDHGKIVAEVKKHL